MTTPLTFFCCISFLAQQNLFLESSWNIEDVSLRLLYISDGFGNIDFMFNTAIMSSGSMINNIDILSCAMMNEKGVVYFQMGHKMNGPVWCQFDQWGHSQPGQGVLSGPEGGGGHWLFEVGYQLRNYSPPFLTKDMPWFCYLQIYSPLFSWIPKNSPLKSALSGNFLYCICHILPNYCIKRFQEQIWM